MTQKVQSYDPEMSRKVVCKKQKETEIHVNFSVPFTINLKFPQITFKF